MARGKMKKAPKGMKKPTKKPADRVVDMAKGANLKTGPRPTGKKKKPMQ